MGRYTFGGGWVQGLAARMAHDLLYRQHRQLKYSAGGLPHAAMMDCIERFANEVVPQVRDLLAREAAPARIGIAA